MTVSDDEIIKALRATVFGSSEERNKARKIYLDLISQSIDENWENIRNEFIKEAPRMSIVKLEDALSDYVVSDLAKKELERRAREEAREKRKKEKRDRTNEDRANLIQLDKIVEIINLIGEIQEINLPVTFSDNKTYDISLASDEKDIKFKVIISSGKVLQIGINFNPYEYYEGFYDSGRTVQNTTFSICFSKLGKHMYFVGKTNTSRIFLTDLTADQLIKELTPCDVNNAKLSWDYVSKNKDIMPTQSDLQFIINMLNDTIGTKDSSEGVITQNKI